MTRVELPLYPVFLRMQAIPVLVVGGGVVATRRIRKLLEVSAKIIVIAPDVTEEIRNWSETGILLWYPRTFDVKDIKGMKFAFALTNDTVVNEEVVSEARQKGCLTNHGSHGGAGDIILPAVTRIAAVEVAISTRGVSPGLAKQLRVMLEADIQQGTSGFIDMLRNLRNHESDTPSCGIPNDFVDL